MQKEEEEESNTFSGTPPSVSFFFSIFPSKGKILEEDFYLKCDGGLGSQPSGESRVDCGGWSHLSKPACLFVRQAATASERLFAAAVQTHVVMLRYGSHGCAAGAARGAAPPAVRS